MARPCGSLKATLYHMIRVILSFQKVTVATLGRTNWRGGYRRARSTWKSPGKEAITVGTGVVSTVKGRSGRILKLSERQNQLDLEID